MYKYHTYINIDKALGQSTIFDKSWTHLEYVLLGICDVDQGSKPCMFEVPLPFLWHQRSQIKMHTVSQSPSASSSKVHWRVCCCVNSIKKRWVETKWVKWKWENVHLHQPYHMSHMRLLWYLHWYATDDVWGAGRETAIACSLILSNWSSSLQMYREQSWGVACAKKSLFFLPLPVHSNPSLNMIIRILNLMFTSDHCTGFDGKLGPALSSAGGSCEWVVRPWDEMIQFYFLLGNVI